MTNKKTLAFVINSLDPGGAERVVTTLANELISNFNVVIVTIINCDSFYELDKRIRLVTCDLILHDKKNLFTAISQNIFIIKKLSSLIKLEQINIIIGFTTSVNVITIISAKINKVPIIISERNNAEVNPPNPFWRLLRNITYKHANYLVVQTSNNRLFYSKIISNHKIIIIRNPIAPALALKRDINKKKNKIKTILTVGRLNANKSQDLLIRAFANIVKNDEWRLELVGDGNKMDAYKTIAKDLNILDRTTFSGNITNVYDYYNNASIFVFTSKSEGYPNALAEALYFGVPCISTDCPYGPSDLIDHNVNGVLVEVDNQKMLEVELERLMKDENLRKSLSKCAITNSDRLNINLITSTWLNYINKLL